MYLNCHSYHSLRYGTIPLNELVEQAANFGIKALALTDVNTVTGIYDFVKDNLEFDQLICEFGDNNNPAWVHVSLKRIGKNRVELNDSKIVKESHEILIVKRSI